VIDFVGPIQPQGKKMGPRYIITMTKYLNRWARVQPMKNCTRMTTAKFIFKYVLTRFGCTKMLMSNHGMHFLNETISTLTKEFQVYH